MDTVRQYVKASGKTTLKDFFGSEYTEFDARSKNLRDNIRNGKSKRLHDLVDGPSGDEDEDKMRDLMVAADNSYEIVRQFQVMGKWEGLDDELPEGHLDPIASRIAQLLDQRDYPVYQLVRRYLSLLDYNASPTLGDCIDKLMSWPVEFQPDEIDKLLSRKAEILTRITSAVMRDRVNMVNAARVTSEAVQRVWARQPHRANDLTAFLVEVRYTTQIGLSLARLDYRPLYPVLADLVDAGLSLDSNPPPPGLNLILRTAARDTFLRMALEFQAAKAAVDKVGSSDAQATINRFMKTMAAGLDNFPTVVPAQGPIDKIAAALDDIAANIADLRTLLSSLPASIVGMITIPALLESDDDDKARALINQLQAQGSLARLSFDIKHKLVNALLDGSTVDDDEIAIIRVMEAAKAYDPAELYQITASATWEALFTSVDGEEYNTMEAILDGLT
jgi:hypothetical protein